MAEEQAATETTTTTTTADEAREEEVVEVTPAHAAATDEKEEEEKPRKRWCEVVVHVYDLSEEMNDRLFRIGLGLYHSGVELVELDREYWFQGHDQRYTGVLEIDHRTALRAIPCVRESVSLGRTACTRAEIAAAVDRLTLEYRGCTYNVVRHNCNAFCADLVRALAPERRFPAYINRLANMGSGLLRVLPDALVWWSMGKFGVRRADVELTPQDEAAEPCITPDGAVVTVADMRAAADGTSTSTASTSTPSTSATSKDDTSDQGHTAQASYQGLSGASEGVALLDRRGQDTSAAAAAAARTTGISGPVYLLSAPQQRSAPCTHSHSLSHALFCCLHAGAGAAHRLYTRTMFNVTLAQMEQQMIAEQQLREIELAEEADRRAAAAAAAASKDKNGSS